MNTQTHKSPLQCRHWTQRDVRWRGANLFRNPFGELTREERARLAVVDIDSILHGIASLDNDRRWIFKPFHAYQLIGDCGRGKTTRMLKLQRQCRQSSYVYLAEDEPCPAIPEGNPLLIDEAQRLPRKVRRCVFQAGLPLVLATHRDLTRPLRRAGYTVYTDQIGHSLSAETLAEILNRRIIASRRDRDGGVPLIEHGVASELIGRFGTDIRAIEGYLYDIVQSQVNQNGEMRFID